jgi:hypothetical protein
MGTRRFGVVKVRSFVPLAVLAAFLLSLGAWPAAMAADDGLSISGRLSGSAGNLGGIAISGCTTDWSFCSETATTDDDGNFTLGSLAAGAYILTVQTGPTYIWGYYQGPGLTQDFSAATPVDVTGGSVSLPEVDLSVAFSISGGVTGAAGGLGSLDISACLVGSMGCMSEAWPDAAGNYSLAGLAPGTYQVSMRDQNHVYVSGLYTGNGLTHEFSDATEITVTDANVVLPSFEVPLGVSVRGTVTGDAGNLAGITMSASEDDFGTGSYGETHPDAAGNFVIGGLWPGDYRIRI